MNKQSEVIINLVSKVQDIVKFLKENDLDPELAKELISSIYDGSNSKKEEPKKELSIAEAREVAEKDGKGYSYFGKWYTNRKTLQKELHLYGKEIDAFIKRMMGNGATLKEAIEDYVGRLVFGDIEEEIYGKKVKISDFCMLNNIPMGIIRARKLERKSSYKDEIIKYIRSNDISPKYPEDKPSITPVAVDSITKIEVEKSTMVIYNGKEYSCPKNFFDSFQFKGANSHKISTIAKENNISIGRAADMWLENKFNKCTHIVLRDVPYNSLTELLKFHHIPFCDFWLYCRDNSYKGSKGQKIAIEEYRKYYPEKFRDNELVHYSLEQPCTYDGKEYASGMELFKKYGVGISYGISAMQERGLSPAEVVDYHSEDGEFITPKSNRIDPKYEPTGKQKLIEQSYTKIRSKKTDGVEYQGKKYSSRAEALDDLGMTTEEGNVAYRMNKKGTTFEEAVDDVLVNKKNTGRKKKEEGSFVYAQVSYSTLNEACKCYNIRESKVRSYAYDYGVNLDTAFGILVGDIKEKDCGIKKKRMYQENIWA